MRHRVKGRKLGRTASHRKATLRALATALLKHKKITTTLAKAKETRTFVEGLITKAKNDSVFSRRFVARFINDKDVVRELFSDIREKIGDRPGGYTRVVRLGHRFGDAAQMAMLELVDYNEINQKKSEEKRLAKEEKIKANKEKAENANEAIDDANVIEETKNEAKSVDEKHEENK